MYAAGALRFTHTNSTAQYYSILTGNIIETYGTCLQLTRHAKRRDIGFAGLYDFSDLNRGLFSDDALYKIVSVTIPALDSSVPFSLAVTIESASQKLVSFRLKMPDVLFLLTCVQQLFHPLTIPIGLTKSPLKRVIMKKRRTCIFFSGPDIF